MPKKSKAASPKNVHRSDSDRSPGSPGNSQAVTLCGSCGKPLPCQCLDLRRGDPPRGARIEGEQFFLRLAGLALMFARFIQTVQAVQTEPKESKADATSSKNGKRKRLERSSRAGSDQVGKARRTNRGRSNVDPSDRS